MTSEKVAVQVLSCLSTHSQNEEGYCILAPEPGYQESWVSPLDCFLLSVYQKTLTVALHVGDNVYEDKGWTK